MTKRGCANSKFPFDLRDRKTWEMVIKRGMKWKSEKLEKMDEDRKMLEKTPRTCLIFTWKNIRESWKFRSVKWFTVKRLKGTWQTNDTRLHSMKYCMQLEDDDSNETCKSLLRQITEKRISNCHLHLHQLIGFSFSKCVCYI